jgi:anaerobic magnesium-protoporphyrin IX monomethyl ester cyclase
VVAYSAMTPDEHLFVKADAIVRRWAIGIGRRVLRIMGGAHPTYFPEVLSKMNLDAICAGDGENAIIRVIDAFAEHKPLEGIPNMADAWA